jgi:hypothetical protein
MSIAKTICENKQFNAIMIVLMVILVSFGIQSGLAQETPDMSEVNRQVSEAEKVLAGPPVPPETIDTKEILEAAKKDGVLAGTQGTYVVLGEDGASSDSASAPSSPTEYTPDSSSTVPDSGSQSGSSDVLVESKPNQKVFSLSQDIGKETDNKDTAAAEPPKKQNETFSAGRPALYLSNYILDMPAQECMRRAKAAFESLGMKIGNGDYWWYGAFDSAFHSYNICLDIGGGKSIVNFTTTSWGNDASDQINRLTKAFNSAPGALPKKDIYEGAFEATYIPGLYMWVDSHAMSVQNCLDIASKALKSEGMEINGDPTWFVGGYNDVFNSYVICNDIGNGNVTVNITASGSPLKDVAGHWNRIIANYK